MGIVDKILVKSNSQDSVSQVREAINLCSLMNKSNAAPDAEHIYERPATDII